MGGEESKENSANGADNKIVLKLRTRDIVLHYAFKMKAVISDIALFPHQLEGLKLWDADVTLARYAILESERFRNKTVLVFKAGVGLAGVSVAKWTDCKSVAMCDVRVEVVQNIAKNCEKNGVKGLDVFEVDLKELHNYPVTYDVMLCTDLMNQGFHPQTVVNLARKLVRVDGEAVIVMPERKQEAKRLLEAVSREEFRISNAVLTADEYADSPLYNKLEGEQEFPLIGNTNFYAITLHKIAEPPLAKQAHGEEEEEAEREKEEVREVERERSGEEEVVSNNASDNQQQLEETEAKTEEKPAENKHAQAEVQQAQPAVQPVGQLKHRRQTHEQPAKSGIPESEVDGGNKDLSKQQPQQKGIEKEEVQEQPEPQPETVDHAESEQDPVKAESAQQPVSEKKEEEETAKEGQPELNDRPQSAEEKEPERELPPQSQKQPEPETNQGPEASAKLEAVPESVNDAEEQRVQADQKQSEETHEQQSTAVEKTEEGEDGSEAVEESKKEEQGEEVQKLSKKQRKKLRKQEKGGS